MVEIRGDKEWVDPKVINLVTREEWGALPPKEELKPMPLPLKVIAYSCNTEQLNVCRTKEECIEVVKAIQKNHMEEKGLPDIAYNFLIGDDDNVYEGRGWNQRPALYEEDPVRYERAMDVAYIGISQAKYLHYAMYESVQWLQKLSIEKKYLEPDYIEIDFCDKEDDFDPDEDEDMAEDDNSPETPTVNTENNSST